MVLLPRGISPGFAGLAVLLALLTAWGLSRDVVRGALRERAFDLVLPLLPRPAYSGPGVVIVDIDRDALARFGAWPWPRGRLAEVVAAVAAGKPAAIGLDMLLAGPDRFSADGDATLAQALSDAPSVLGFVLETANSGPGPAVHADPVARAGVAAGRVARQWDRRTTAGARRCARRVSAPWSRRPTPMARSAACRCWSWRAASCGQAWRSSWYGLRRVPARC